MAEKIIKLKCLDDKRSETIGNINYHTVGLSLHNNNKKIGELYIKHESTNDLGFEFTFRAFNFKYKHNKYRLTAAGITKNENKYENLLTAIDIKHKKSKDVQYTKGIVKTKKEPESEIRTYTIKMQK